MLSAGKMTFIFIYHVFTNRVAFTTVCLHGAHPLSLMMAENEMFRQSLDNGRVAQNSTNDHSRTGESYI